MKKRIPITISIILILSICLAGCNGFNLFPEVGSEEEKKLQEHIEKIENRIYVTVYSSIEVFKNETPQPNITVSMSILSSSGFQGSWYKDTNDAGYVDFDPVNCNLDMGDEISATALHLPTGISRAKWLYYDIAKEKATHDNKTGYTYSWYVSIPLEI